MIKLHNPFMTNAFDDQRDAVSAHKQINLECGNCSKCYSWQFRNGYEAAKGNFQRTRLRHMIKKQGWSGGDRLWSTLICHVCNRKKYSPEISELAKA